MNEEQQQGQADRPEPGSAGSAEGQGQADSQQQTEGQQQAEGQQQGQGRGRPEDFVTDPEWQRLTDLINDDQVMVLSFEPDNIELLSAGVVATLNMNALQPSVRFYCADWIDQNGLSFSWTKGKVPQVTSYLKEWTRPAEACSKETDCYRCYDKGSNQVATCQKNRFMYHNDGFRLLLTVIDKHWYDLLATGSYLNVRSVLPGEYDKYQDTDRRFVPVLLDEETDETLFSVPVAKEGTSIQGPQGAGKSAALQALLGKICNPEADGYKATVLAFETGEDWQERMKDAEEAGYPAEVQIIDELTGFWTDTGIESLKDAIEPWGPNIIAIDSLNYAKPADISENSPDWVPMFWDRLKNKVAKPLDIKIIIFVVHEGQDLDFGARGTTAINAVTSLSLRVMPDLDDEDIHIMYPIPKTNKPAGKNRKRVPICPVTIHHRREPRADSGVMADVYVFGHQTDMPDRETIKGKKPSQGYEGPGAKQQTMTAEERGLILDVLKGSLKGYTKWTVADKVKMNRSKVERFLKLLEKEGKVVSRQKGNSIVFSVADEGRQADLDNGLY